MWAQGTRGTKKKDNFIECGTNSQTKTKHKSDCYGKTITVHKVPWQQGNRLGFVTGRCQLAWIFKGQTSHFTLESGGLVVSVSNQWLATNPDGLVFDPLEEHPQGLVELKNPYTVRDMTLEEAAMSCKMICLEMLLIEIYNWRGVMISTIKCSVQCIALIDSRVI